jgi:hypothetical protein
MIREQISGVGQPYYDKPIVVRLKASLTSIIAVSMRLAFNSSIPPVIVVGHERIKLRWVSPKPL